MVKIWTRDACPCGCGSVIYLRKIGDTGFMMKVPGGVSRIELANGLRRFRKEIQTHLAVLNAVQKGKNYHEKSNQTIH